MKVEEGITKLTVPHEDREVTFAHLPISGTYSQVQEQLQAQGLRAPSMAEVASLVYDAFVVDPDNQFSKEIKETMRYTWLRSCTGNLCVPNRGVFVQDQPEVINGRVAMNQEDLERKLEENNPSVRFVPFGFKTRFMSPFELIHNKYVIALAGKEGAIKLAEVACNKGPDTYLMYLENTDQLRTITSTLGFAWFGNGLGVNGFGFDSSAGYLFGVQEKRK